MPSPLEWRSRAAGISAWPAVSVAGIVQFLSLALFIESLLVFPPLSQIQLGGGAQKILVAFI